MKDRDLVQPIAMQLLNGLMAGHLGPAIIAEPTFRTETIKRCIQMAQEIVAELSRE